MASTPPLAGRRILVTGATSGIGEALATTLAITQGAYVIAIGRRSERLAQLAARVASSGGQIETHALSITDRAAVSALCNTLAGAGIDDLILNAGVTSADSFVEGSQAIDQNIIDTNISANLQLIRELITPLTSGKTGGRILLMASLGGLVPVPYQSVYAGSKAFLVNFGLSLREELKAHGLCVLVFAPGGVATEMTDIDALAKLQSQLADVDSVADDAIRMFIARRAFLIPGWQNKLVALFARLLSRQTLARIAARIYRDARAD